MEESVYKKNLEIVPHHKMGIKILDKAQLKNLFPDYESLLERIEEHRKQLNVLNRKKDYIDNQYNLMYDNVFSIMGKRGAGKTSAVLTLKQLLRSRNKNDIVLPIIMPEIIPQECSMIGWILSLLEESVKELEVLSEKKPDGESLFFEGCMRKSNDSLLREYNKVKELCYSQFYQVQAAESFTAAIVNTEQQTQNSFNFSHELVRFWDELVRTVKQTCSPDAEPLIYIIFDDVDLMPDAVISLMSTIIKYLSHPNLIVFVTADEDLLYDVIENSMNKRLGKYEELKTYSALTEAAQWDDVLQEGTFFSEMNKERLMLRINEKLEIEREIPKLYGDKILPPSCKYYLRTFKGNKEKARFIERVQVDESDQKETEITLEKFVKDQIAKYIQETGQEGAANFVLYKDKFIKAYFAFWGETSRQLANETLILKDFINHVISIHNKFRKNEYTEEEYYENFYYIIKKFMNSTLNALGNVGLSLKEVSELVDELIVYVPENWGIYLNYSYLRELTENRMNNERLINLKESIRQPVLLVILLFFIENILLMEKKSLASLQWGERKRIHGRGILVDILDHITGGKNSLVCKSQGEDLNEFLVFYEGIIDSPEILIEYDISKVRSVRVYLQTLPLSQTDVRPKMDYFERHNPKWLRTIAQILYLSSECIFDIQKPQLLMRKLIYRASEFYDPYYLQKLDECKEFILDTLSNVYKWKKRTEQDEMPLKDFQPEELFVMNCNNEDIKEVSDLEELEGKLAGLCEFNQKPFQNLVYVGKGGTEFLLEQAENACRVLSDLYDQFDFYKFKNREEYEKLQEEIYDLLEVRIICDEKNLTVDRGLINNLLERISREVSAMKIKSNQDWNYSIETNIRRLETLFLELSASIHLAFVDNADIERGKEIVKWNVIFMNLQKYYLISWILDKKGSGESRINRKKLPYKNLYESIKAELDRSDNKYLGQMLHNHIREACTKYMQKLWQE